MFLKKKKQPAAARRRPAPGSPRIAGVFSYHAVRSPRPGSQGRERETAQNNTPDAPQSAPRPGRSRRLLVVLTVIVLLALTVNVSLVSPQPEVAVAGNAASQAFLQERRVYEQAAARLIEASPFNRNKITFDTNGVSRHLLEQFPELEAVSVTHPVFGRKPVVHIQAFKPRIILDGSSGIFVLNQEGRAFLPGSQVPALERFDLPVVRDQSGLEIHERQIILPEREVAFITEVDRQLKAKDIAVTAYTLPPGGSQLEVSVQDAPYTIRFNMYGNAREGAGRYLAAREYLQSRGETPGEYIDVRVDNHVYYR